MVVPGQWTLFLLRAGQCVTCRSEGRLVLPEYVRSLVTQHRRGLHSHCCSSATRSRPRWYFPGSFLLCSVNAPFLKQILTASCLPETPYTLKSSWGSLLVVLSFANVILFLSLKSSIFSSFQGSEVILGNLLRLKWFSLWFSQVTHFSPKPI